jgi:hypothetical protein
MNPKLCTIHYAVSSMLHSNNIGILKTIYFTYIHSEESLHHHENTEATQFLKNMDTVCRLHWKKPFEHV